MGSNRALGVLLVLAALRAGQAAPLWPPWPRPVPGGEQLDSAWERTLNLLWGETKDRIGFCVGRSQWKVQRLASLSFPWPLPVTADASDALCSNSSRIDLHLCDPLEIKQYYKVGCMKGFASYMGLLRCGRHAAEVGCSLALLTAVCFDHWFAAAWPPLRPCPWRSSCCSPTTPSKSQTLLTAPPGPLVASPPAPPAFLMSDGRTARCLWPSSAPTPAARATSARRS